MKKIPIQAATIGDAVKKAKAKLEEIKKQYFEENSNWVSNTKEEMFKHCHEDPELHLVHSLEE